MPGRYRPCPPWLAFGLLSALGPGTLRAAEPPSPEQVQFFEAKVRPLLVENCVSCHGPAKQKSHLRLDSLAAALTGGDSGPALVAGKPEESLIVLAVQHGDDAPKMPPSRKLPKGAVDDLTRWVKIGAPWPGGDTPAPATSGAPAATALRRPGMAITDKDRAHWAFQPVRRVEIPRVTDPESSLNPIDAFVHAGLEAKGLTPNPPAGKRQLIRRATYDLTGLPPTPEDVAAFVNDPSPGAYAALVDRLLESPHYGEKWGRHWLDLVRFAETNSYERDNPKPSAWRYRDYVIRSLNADKPYDRFVREQLAGDELPGGGDDALIATGYYRLGIWDDEPTDREQALYDGLDDVVATTGQVFLGLTVDCARCHDHKIDPIPQKDYYSLLAFFRNVNPYRNGGPTDEAPLLGAPGAREAYEARVRSLKADGDALQAKITAIEGEFLARYDAGGGSNGSVRIPDLDDLRYRFYRDTWDKLPDFDALKPEATGVLPGRRFDLAPRSRDEAFGFVFEGTLIVPTDGSYTFDLDSDDGTRLSLDGAPVLTHDGSHPTGTPQNAKVHLTAGRHRVRLDYFQGGGGFSLNVGWSGPGFARRSLSANPRGDLPAGDDLTALLRSEGLRVLGKARMEQLRALRRELKAKIETTIGPETALVVTESGASAPPTHVMLRGNPHVPGEEVRPGFLSVLGTASATIPSPPSAAKTSGRRTVLADWIASGENPLTARVMVNRVWQHHFGRGIVRSSSNFGTQGDRPTHPELLDRLAAEFVAGDWKLKPLHRLIMTSRAYQMSSQARPEALAKDPANESLWRFEMRRLTAEELRDSILTVSGRLNPKMFGPGVYPEIPAEVMAGQSVPGSGWGQSRPEEAARRSIYVHVKRSLLPPILESFDVAETDRSSPVRFSTTQPTQALAMVNGKFLNGEAAALARRLRTEVGDDPEAQVRRGLSLVAARVPSELEVRRGVTLIENLTRREGLSADDALRAFSLVALNLNEFLYID